MTMIVDVKIRALECPHKFNVIVNTVPNLYDLNGISNQLADYACKNCKISKVRRFETGIETHTTYRVYTRYNDQNNTFAKALFDGQNFIPV